MFWFAPRCKSSPEWIEVHPGLHHLDAFPSVLQEFPGLFIFMDKKIPFSFQHWINPGCFCSLGMDIIPQSNILDFEMGLAFRV